MSFSWARKSPNTTAPTRSPKGCSTNSARGGCSTPPSARPGLPAWASARPCCGLRPIVEFMSWSFTLVCLDQIVNNAANVRYMSGGQFKVPIVFRGGNGIAHQLGATHSHRVESIYARIPGLIVVCPSTPYDAKGLLKSAIRCDDPVIFLESEKMLNDDGEVPRRGISRCRWAWPMSSARRGRDGHQLWPAAAARGARGGRCAGQRSRHRCRTDRPAHASPAGYRSHSSQSIKKTHRCVIVDEDWGYCGMGAGIIQKIQKPVLR